jgi:hypothetical protein
VFVVFNRRGHFGSLLGLPSSRRNGRDEDACTHGERTSQIRQLDHDGTRTVGPARNPHIDLVEAAHLEGRWAGVQYFSR